jgi:tetratricopeptide (TPR) repeat protein
VQVILAARIDRLPADDKQLLQTASVIGKDVPFVLLRAVAEAAEDAVQRGLTQLQAAEFLYETRLFPDPEYTFKHALTHEVTYGTLLHERRKTLHARIVSAIERCYADRLTEHVERLAHHAFRGEAWEKAVTYLRQAGAKALTRSVNREAVACFEQALVALHHLPETRETLELAIDLRFDLRTSLYPLGEFERMLGCLRETERLARTLGDQRRLGWVSAFMSSYLWATGDSTRAHTLAQAVQAIAKTVGDLPLQVGANWWLGATCFALGDYRRGEEFCRQNVEFLQGDLTRERFGLVAFPAVLDRAWLAQSLAERGEFDEGIAYGQEGIRIAEALDHPFSVVMALWGLAYLYGVKGDLSQAVRLHERGVAFCREWDLSTWSPLVTGSLGYGYVLSGRVEEGLSLLQQSLTALESMGYLLWHSLVVGYLGEACLRADRLKDASAVAGRALTLARERKERGSEARALWLLGEIASHHDPRQVEKTDAHYREAMALAEELGMRPLVAHCHLGLGKLYRRTGKREQAQEHLSMATTMYREMGMTYWLKKAQSEMPEPG